MEGGKGGSSFNPHGRSATEVLRIIQSIKTEIFRHIGPNRDIPAGDIGVGSREIGYLFGQYKRLKNEFTGVLTGKGVSWGGSLIRPEATGYGVVYFANQMLKNASKSIKNKSVIISGSGNVAQYAAEKCINLGAKVLTLSDSSGFIFDPDGINIEKLHYIMELKNIKRLRISEYVKKFSKATFYKNKTPWKNETWHKVKLVRDTKKGTIEVYFDDMKTPHMSITDKTFGKGRIGIGSFDDMNDFDNVKLRGR